MHHWVIQSFATGHYSIWNNLYELAAHRIILVKDHQVNKIKAYPMIMRYTVVLRYTTLSHDITLVWSAISLTNNDNADIQLPQSRTCLITVFRLEDGHAEYLGMINNGPEQPDSGWISNLFLFLFYRFLSILSDPKISWRCIVYLKPVSMLKSTKYQQQVSNEYTVATQEPSPVSQTHADSFLFGCSVFTERLIHTLLQTKTDIQALHTASQGSVVLDLVISTETETALFVCPLPAAEAECVCVCVSHDNM